MNIKETMHDLSLYYEPRKMDSALFPWERGGMIKCVLSSNYFTNSPILLYFIILVR